MIRCDQCRFWDPNPTAKFGKCRRSAPVLIISDARGQWPTTAADDGCGEGNWRTS